MRKRTGVLEIGEIKVIEFNNILTQILLGFIKNLLKKFYVNNLTYINIII